LFYNQQPQAGTTPAFFVPDGMIIRGFLLILVAAFCAVQPSRAQSQVQVSPPKIHYDTNYVESYRGYLMPRFHITRKTTGIRYHNAEKGYSLRYQPNKTFNIGVGMTYKFLTLKIGIGVLPPYESRGKTRDLDLQFNSYGKRLATDVILQFYKGFYLPAQTSGMPAQEFYVRPDLAVSALGGTVQYVFNNRKFSYRAAFQQTELQKKSAGTILVGMELFMGRFRADSTIVPSAIQRVESDGLRKMRFIEFGPNVGYAYTWVLNKFFLTTIASIGLNGGINRFYDGDGATTFTGFSPNTVFKVSAGYNIKRWGFNMLYLSRALHLPEFEDRSIVVNTGTLRMNFIYRINPNLKVRKMLKPIDKVDQKLKD
jgi:hypothetical protein